MVNALNLRVGIATLSLLGLSIAVPMAGCERNETKGEAHSPQKLTPEQIEQQRVEEAKKAEAAE